MKQLLLALALCVVTAQPVLAQQAFRPTQEQNQNQLRSKRDVVGGIIGGIIGGVIAAEILDRDDHRHQTRPRPVVCYAESYRGRIFQEYGHGARRVQWQAISWCEQSSRYRCRPLGCQAARQPSRWPNDPRHPHRGDNRFPYDGDHRFPYDDDFGGPIVFGRY